MALAIVKEWKGTSVTVTKWQSLEAEQEEKEKQMTAGWRVEGNRILLPLNLAALIRSF